MRIDLLRGVARGLAVSRLDFQQKLRIAGPAFLLCLLSALLTFFSEIPVYLIAIPVVVFEMGSWHLFIRLQDDYEPFLPFKFRSSRNAFVIYHIVFYSVILFVNAINHDDPVSKTLGSIAFCSLVASAIVANTLAYWPNDVNSDELSIAQTRTLRILLIFARLPIIIVGLILSIDFTIRILSNMFGTSYRVIESLNTQQIFGLLIAFTLADGLVYGLGTNSSHIDSIGKRFLFAINTAIRAPLIRLATIYFFVAIVQLHTHMVSLSYAIEPMYYWSAIWIIDCLIPLTIYMRSEYSSGREYPFVDGSVAIGATPQWWASGYLRISATALFLSSLLGDRSQLPDGAWGILLGTSLAYLGFVAVYTQMLEVNAWRSEL